VTYATLTSDALIMVYAASAINCSNSSPEFRIAGLLSNGIKWFGAAPAIMDLYFLKVAWSWEYQWCQLQQMPLKLKHRPLQK